MLCIDCGERRHDTALRGFRFFRRGRLSVCDACWKVKPVKLVWTKKKPFKGTL